MFDWILSIIHTGGYVGIFLLLVLENLFPPIPSELVIPLAGYAAASGTLNVFYVLLATVCGSMVGTLPWYAVGYFYGSDRLRALMGRFGRFFGTSPKDIDVAQRWFTKYGHLAVLFGRDIPGVRAVISIPAGIARMRFSTFFWYSLWGTLVWNSFLLLCGYMLQSQYELVERYANRVLDAVVIAVIFLYVYRVITYKRPTIPAPPMD